MANNKQKDFLQYYTTYTVYIKLKRIKDTLKFDKLILENDKYQFEAKFIDPNNTINKLKLNLKVKQDKKIFMPIKIAQKQKENK